VSSPSPFDPEVAARRLLVMQNASLESLIALPGGRNNRVWKVTGGGQNYLLKHYFWSEADPRDRLGQEWAFLEFLKRIGCVESPEPLARNPTSRCALLEFIAGTPIPEQEITESDIVAATQFFLQMNRKRDQAGTLSTVSEACFSIEEHLKVTAKRVSHLARIQPVSRGHAEAKNLAENHLRSLWASIQECVRGRAGGLLEQPLPEGERCLSPSDFGFHNALREADGRIRFIDFEYAGWDDPAKTIIDFSNQPDRILPSPLSQIFREAVLESFPSARQLAQRVQLLAPVYQLKWSCICLNGFFRDYAGFSAELQLAQAKEMAARAAESLDALSRNH